MDKNESEGANKFHVTLAEFYCVQNQMMFILVYDILKMGNWQRQIESVVDGSGTISISSTLCIYFCAI